MTIEPSTMVFHRIRYDLRRITHSAQSERLRAKRREAEMLTSRLASPAACRNATLDSPPWRVYDVDHASLYRHVPGGHEEVLVVPVLGPEPKEVPLPVEPLDGDLLATPDEGCYDGAVC